MEKTIKPLKKASGRAAAAAPEKTITKSGKATTSASKPVPRPSKAAVPSKPASTPAKPGTAATKPDGAATKPAGPQAKPAPIRRKPVAAKAKPAPSQNKPAAAKAKPGPSQRKPTAAKAKPGPSQRKPTAAKAQPAPSQSKPPAKPAKPVTASAAATPGAAQGKAGVSARIPAETVAKPATARPSALAEKPQTPSAALADKPRTPAAARARLTLSSRNYSSWSLRGWLLTRFAGLECDEVSVAPDHPDRRAELLLLSPSILVPMLEHEGLRIWDVLAITEYLNERFPKAGLLPGDTHARARCRSICGEIHSGFSALRSALPMNLRMRQRQFKVWSRAQADIDRVFTIWTECLSEFGGPFLFGARSAADAMYAPVVTRLRTYDVPIPAELAGYCGTILAMPEMKEWEAAAAAEPDQLEEFDVEF